SLAGDQFGFTVASIEDDILIGAPLLGSTDTGAVFIFDKRTQRRRTTLRNPVPTTGDFFGAAIAADGGTVAVGAPLDGTGGWKGRGGVPARAPPGGAPQGKPAGERGRPAGGVVGGLGGDQPGAHGGWCPGRRPRAAWSALGFRPPVARPGADPRKSEPLRR